MQYRIDKERLFEILSIWDSFLKRKVHLIACGGTALTLLEIKDSTKDIDFLLPNEAEYAYLIAALKNLGYVQKTGYGWSRDDGFIFELFPGNTIFTTRLLESPLKEGNNIMAKEFEHVYVGILNYYDLLISKIFRFSTADQDDCLALIKAKREEIDFDKFRNRFFEASSCDISDEKNRKNFENFLTSLKRQRIGI